MIDNLDRKILKLLELDSRQSKARIADQLHIHKTMVTYRINRLSKKGVINGYQYLTDQARLGATSFGLLIRFEGLLLSEQQRLLGQVSAAKIFAWMSLTNGAWDAMAVVLTQDVASFTKTLDAFFVRFGTHVKEYKFYMDYQGIISSHNYLYDESYPDYASYSNANEKIKLNELQQRICDLVRVHPTMSILRMAERLDKTYDTVKSHYRALMLAGVLLKCVPIINYELLGYTNTIALYDLRPKTQRIDNFWQFCEKHPNIVRQARCLGNFNLVLNIHSKDNHELKEITSIINKQFSDIINSYDVVHVVGRHA